VNNIELAMPIITPSPVVASLRSSVEGSLRHYLKNLDGQHPFNLYDLVLREMEIPLLQLVMEYVRGNQCKAARLLGINRGTLRKKLKRYKIED
jgi:Fis family transcriptional regulator, factor for inversion stimulation protein